MDPVSNFCLQLASICDTAPLSNSQQKDSLVKGAATYYGSVIMTAAEPEDTYLEINNIFLSACGGALSPDMGKEIFNLCSTESSLDPKQRSQIAALFNQFAKIQSDDKELLMSPSKSMEQFLKSDTAKKINLEKCYEPEKNYTSYDKRIITSNEWGDDDNNNNSGNDWRYSNENQSTIITPPNESEKYKWIDVDLGNTRKRKLEKEVNAGLKKTREEYAKKMRQEIAELELQNKFIKAENQKADKWLKIKQGVQNQIKEMNEKGIKDAEQYTPQLLWNHLASTILKEGYSNFKELMDCIQMENENKLYTVTQVLNQTDEKGNSLLHCLVHSESFTKEEKSTSITYLVQQGCDPNSANKEGKTPLDCALSSLFEVEKIKPDDLKSTPAVKKLLQQNNDLIKDLPVNDFLDLIKNPRANNLLDLIIDLLKQGTFISSEYYHPFNEEEFSTTYPNKLSLLIEINLRRREKNQEELIAVLAQKGALIGLEIAFDKKLKFFDDYRDYFFLILTGLINPLLFNCQFDKELIDNYITQETAITDQVWLAKIMKQEELKSEEDFFKFCIEKYHIILGNLNRKDLKENIVARETLIECLAILYKKLAPILGKISLTHLAKAAFWKAEAQEVKQNLKKTAFWDGKVQKLEIQEIERDALQKYIYTLAENPRLNKESLSHPLFLQTLNNWYQQVYQLYLANLQAAEKEIN